MFDTLTGRLDGIFKKLRSRGKLHPKQVDAALADLRVALLEADVAAEGADDLLAPGQEGDQDRSGRAPGHDGWHAGPVRPPIRETRRRDDGGRPGFGEDDRVR